MKRFFIAALLVATLINVHARELTPQEALARVQSQQSQLKPPRRIAAASPRLAYTVKSTIAGREATAYLFSNRGADKGYLLLSADDSLVPVLGYSNNATISGPDDMPDNMRWWLSEVGREADYALEHNAKLKAPASLGPAIEPLLKSQWDQGDPYNLYTPTFNGKHAPTGCVATAMAQIMYYHKWPVQPQGSNSYVWNGNTYSIDFSDVTFDWDKMTDTYDSNSTQESKEAVATLMKAVGYSVNMMYDERESGAYDFQAETSFKKYFQYNDLALSYYRNGKTSQQWSEAVYSNISGGMPVYYSGSGNAGHAFVCDGYDGNGYFHFNWGWGGSLDGYFMLSYLTPGGAGIGGDISGYNYNQSIILNLFPDNEQEFEPYYYLSGIIYDYNPEQGGINLQIDSPQIEGEPVELAIEVSSQKDSSKIVVPFGQGIVGNSSSFSVDNGYISSLNKIEIYELRLLWREGTGMFNYSIGSDSNGILYYDGKSWKFERMSLEPTEFNITNVKFNESDNIYSGANNILTFNATNNLSEHIFRKGAFVLIDANTGNKVATFKSEFNESTYKIELAPYDEKEFRFIAKANIPTGEYYFAFSYEGENKDVVAKDCIFKCTHYTEIQDDIFVYTPVSETNVVISRTVSDEKLGGDVYFPADLTIDGKHYNIIDVDIYNCIDQSKITSIIIDTPITEIFDVAFICPLMKKIRLPYGLKRIGRDAFGCKLLEDINIPETVTYIGDFAFFGCLSLKGDLIIPDSVVEIGEYAFCDAGYDGNLVLGKSLKIIGNSAFNGCSNFTGDLILPESLTNISRYCFNGCSGFNGKLVIPNTVTSIGEFAFTGCSGFSDKLVIPNSVTSIGANAFSGCHGFTGDLIIPNSVTSIGVNAFSDCYGFTGDLVIPNSVTSIGVSAFSNCYGFTGDLIIPNSITTIEGGAFYCCSGFTGDLVIPNSVTLIGSSSFWGCTGFNGKLIIPNSVTSIGLFAFSGCSGFIGDLIIPNSITSIEGQSFFNCSGFNGKLVIPESVTSIGFGAFRFCSGFTGDLIIPDSVQSIDSGAFDGCTGLNGRLSLGKSIKTIGDGSFRYCSGFTGDLVLPEFITSIGVNAFSQCFGFNKTWTVPDIKTLNYVGDNALPWFDNVICLHEEVPECYPANAFFNATIRVKPGYGDLYRTHENWKGYSSLYEYGDANKSMSLTVTDAVADANYIIGGFPGYSFDFDCGDINMNGEISIADVTGIIRAVAKYYPDNLSTSTLRAPRQFAGTLVADDFFLIDESATVNVTMQTKKPVVALQADFICGNGIDIDDIVLAPSLAATHSLMISRFDDDGIVRAIIWSLDNKVIECGSEPVLTLNVSGNGMGKIDARNILCSTADVNEHALGFEGGENLTMLGVGNIDNSQVKIKADNGCIVIANAEGETVHICDITGRTVMIETIDSSEESYHLYSGIYIVTVGNKTSKIVL